MPPFLFVVTSNFYVFYPRVTLSGKKIIAIQIIVVCLFFKADIVISTVLLSMEKSY